jgi:hypothetical protein
MSLDGSVGRCLTLASLAVLAAASSASAGACIDAAAGDYRLCKADCREAFQVAKDACLNRDHACVELCRAERSECRDASGFDADIDQCNDDMEAVIAQCKIDYPAGSTSRDICIDDAQVAGFRCRDQKREENAAELEACRSAFKVCAKACPPADPNPDPNTPVINRRQCRREAKVTFMGCLADCREDFQVAKDACRNLDHECVEACRTQRHDCLEPKLAALEAEIALCNQQRDQTIAGCEVDPAPFPDVDSCVDNAQVIAFQCRDQEREDARPGIRECRDAYKDVCVPACPPATP